MRMNFTVFFLLIVMFVTLSIEKNLLADYPRKVAVEEFTNTGCGSCPPVNKLLKIWFEIHPEIIPIIYHPDFPSSTDPIYLYAKESNDTRQSYYSLPFVPYARINGIVVPNPTYPQYQGYPTDTSALNMVIDTMTKTTPIKLDIDFINYGLTGSISVTVNTDINLSGEKLYVVITEKYHYYSLQYGNGEKDFYNIVRYMLPDGYGTELSINAGGSQKFDFNYELEDGINYELTAVAFVQNDNTKDIYQVESNFQSLSGVNDYSEIGDISIYPNPANDLVSISIANENEFIESISIFSSIGETLASINPEENLNKININVDEGKNSLSTGVYYVAIKSNLKQYYKKLIVSK